MKLLVVDYICTPGHKNFNKIHIDSLSACGYELHIVGRQGQFDNIETDKVKEFTCIPERLFKHLPLARFTARLQSVLRLLYIKRHLRLKDYDAVVFLIYDIFSIVFWKSKVPTFLINHNNVSLLSDPIRYRLTKMLPPQFIHIALSDCIKNRMEALLPNYKIYIVPHGLISPDNKISCPPFLESKSNFIFCPINRNYDIEFVRGIFDSPHFLKYLSDNNLYFCVKDTIPLKSLNERIIKISRSLSKEYYDYLIQKSKVVILPYSEEFKYRCSGIFFECVSRNTPILTTYIEDLLIYKNDVEVHYFKDVYDMVKKIDSCYNIKVNNNLEIFNPSPYWMKTLNDVI